MQEPAVAADEDDPVLAALVSDSVVTAREQQMAEEQDDAPSSAVANLIDFDPVPIAQMDPSPPETPPVVSEALPPPVTPPVVAAAAPFEAVVDTAVDTAVARQSPAPAEPPAREPAPMPMLSPVPAAQSQPQRTAEPEEQAARGLANAMTEEEILAGLDGYDASARAGGRTALHLAASYGHLGVVERLCSSSAVELDVNARTGKAWTPLHKACQHGHAATAKALLAHGADVAARTSLMRTPVHIAAACGSTGCLVEVADAARTADVLDAKDHCGRTAMHRAVFNGHVDCMLELAARGADVNARDKDERTPIHFAVASGRVASMQHLVRLGANLAARDAVGMTLLHYAAENDQEECVIELMDLGLDAAAVSSNGKLVTQCGSGETQRLVTQLLQERQQAATLAQVLLTGTTLARCVQAVPFLCLLLMQLTVLPFVWTFSMNNNRPAMTVIAVAIALACTVLLMLISRSKRLWQSSSSGEYIVLCVTVLATVLYVATGLYVDKQVDVGIIDAVTRPAGRASFAGHLVFLAVLSFAVVPLAWHNHRWLHMSSCVLEWWDLFNSVFLFYNCPTCTDLDDHVTGAIFLLILVRLVVYVTPQIAFSVYWLVATEGSQSAALSAVSLRSKRWVVLHTGLTDAVVVLPLLVLGFKSHTFAAHPYALFALILEFCMLINSLIVNPFMHLGWSRQAPPVVDGSTYRPVGTSESINAYGGGGDEIL